MGRLRRLWAGVKDYAARRWTRLRWHARRWLTGTRFRSVALIGLCDSYNGEYDPKAEVWGCNFAYRHGTRLDRLFAMDGIEEWKAKDPHWITDAAKLDIPITMVKHYAEVPGSRPFPLDRARAEVCSRDYYTSTIAYMFEEAIRLGYGSIIVHRLMRSVASDEYVEQKACLDFWCGVAFGMGINVALSEDSMLVKPYPWQSPLYGYIMQDNWVNAAKMMSSTMHAIDRLPRTFRRAA